MPGVPPVCLSMVVCDEVVRDRATGKATLFGVFRSVLSRSFPMVLPNMAVWVELTSGHRESTLTLSILRLMASRLDGDRVFEAQWTVTFPDPLTVLDFSLKLLAIELPVAGEYLVRLECEGVLIAARRIEVLQQEA